MSASAQRVRLPIVAEAVCNRVWGTGYQAATQVCVGNWTGGVDTCQGDSGGPVLAGLNGYSDLWTTGLQVALTRCARHAQKRLICRLTLRSPAARQACVECPGTGL